MPIPNSSEDIASQSSPPDLAAAVQAAIAKSLRAADGLEAQVIEALASFANVLHDGDDATDTPEAIRLLRAALQTAHAEARDLFTRQRAALATVNIALFGRTGAGKSSLVEALSHGAGESISTGESDFTVEVRPTNWKGIQFSDTPGINGWGRTMSRDELESRTRKAVEVADIIVLCFDDSSQLASEFDKIASWVKEFGKPVICVLNVKKANWRRPLSVPFLSSRQQLSQGLREHSSNIATELAAIGIHGAPIVAISAQRAVYARTSEDYTGPLPEQCYKMREVFGRDELLQQSNLEAFEDVIVEALTSHAMEIRLGMLHGQVRALLERLTVQLKEASTTATTTATALDAAIKGVLVIVGYPPIGSARREALAKTSEGEDLITAAEQARGEAYTLSVEGIAAQFSRQRCNSEFGTLRSKSLAAANKEISDCFDRRCDLDGKVFASRVYDLDSIKETGKKVLTEASDYLKRELKLTLKDAALDLEFTANQASEVAGGAGGMMRNGGYAARIAAMLASAATLAAFAPEPLITKGAAIVLGLAAGLVGWLGEWFGGKAKAEREKAKITAFADATRSVNKTYDDITAQIEASVDAMLQTAGKEALTVPLQTAVVLWRFASEVELAMEQLSLLIAALPAVQNAQRLIDEAARVVARQRNAESVDVAHVLLGEDWISDPRGRKEEKGREEPKRTPYNDAGITERLVAGFRRFAARFARTKAQNRAGAKWLADTEALLATDELATAPLAELRQMLSAGRPRYHLLGDYSTGKTSFIKRLLMDAGQPLPPKLEVRADPATDAIHSYEWEHALLVDSPGLQSGKTAHTEIALESVPDASLLICLFQPNLLVGSTGALEQVLLGDVAKGLAAKLSRTLFVIHRADELGPDPDLVPEQYAQMCKRKQLELQQALASRGISIEIERIVCMAADPHQMVGNRRDVNSTEFDRYRAWDGFKEFHAAIREIHSQSAATGLDYSVLEGGLARLGVIDAKLEVEAKALKFCKVVIARQTGILADITTAGELLEGDLTAAARRLIEDYTQALRTQETRSDDELKIKASTLATWWEQKDFIAKVEHCQEQAQQQIEAWWQNSSEQLERSMNSARFKAAVASASATLDQSPYEPAKPGALKRMLNFVTEPLKGATRDMVYTVGKALGAKFPPRGAINFAKNLRHVGAGLGGLLVAWDAVQLFNHFKNEKKEQRRDEALEAFITQTTEQVFNSITKNGDDTHGPLEALHFLKGELEAVGNELAAERDAINEQNDRLHARRLRYRTSMAAAWTALGQPSPQP